MLVSNVSRFLTMFSYSLLEQNFVISARFKLSSAIAFSFGHAQFLFSSVKALKCYSCKSLSSLKIKRTDISCTNTHIGGLFDFCLNPTKNPQYFNGIV